jgi:acyl dehydratase
VRKLFALTLALVAGLFAAGTASASDYCHGNVTVVRGGYNAVRVVKVVKAAALTRRSRPWPTTTPTPPT